MSYPQITAWDMQDLTLYDYFFGAEKPKKPNISFSGNRKSFVTRVLNVTYFEGLLFLK